MFEVIANDEQQRVELIKRPLNTLLKKKTFFNVSGIYFFRYHRFHAMIFILATQMHLNCVY